MEALVLDKSLVPRGGNCVEVAEIDNVIVSLRAIMASIGKT